VHTPSVLERTSLQPHVEYRQFPQVLRLEALREAKKKDLSEDHAHVAKITAFKHVSRNMNVVAHLLAFLQNS
jgi:hypothetical protein